VERATAQRVEALMRRALALAEAGRGRASPNPMVGAVVVRGGRVVGEGAHRRAGGPHAEVIALRRAGRRAAQATLVVTLEPCRHVGRTPPCCDAIIAAGIREVVIGTRDPNPITRGRGLTRLRRAGIAVTEHVLEPACRQLNAPFEKAMRSGLPFVVGKIAQSLDGKIATSAGASRWISSAPARRYAHHVRRNADAILVGVTTVLRDDPRLTARGHGRPGGRPVKIIVDGQLRTPPSAACLSSRSPASTIIATVSTDDARRRALERAGATVLTFAPQRGRVPLRRLFHELARRGLQTVLIEGGGEVLASAFAERLIDRVLWCIAPIIVGGRTAPGSVGGEGIQRLTDAVRLTDVAVRRCGQDHCLEGRVVYPKGAGGGRQGVRQHRKMSQGRSHAPRSIAA